jgi:mono/diheme cytochrome c family protein
MRKPLQTRKSENADPHEQYNPVPRVVVGLVAGLVVWAVAYIVVARPDGLAGLGDRRVPEALVGSSAPSNGSIDGRQLYVAKCQACHQARGGGLAGVFPPLAQSPWVKDPVQLPVQIVLHGLRGPIDVGNTVYNGVMPGFGEQLNDAELAAVLSFVRSEWGNASPPVTAEAVAAARKSSASQSGAWPSIQELQTFVAKPATSP